MSPFKNWITMLRCRTRMTQIQQIFTDLRASASTVTPVDCVHTYASALAYVDVYSAQSVFHHVCYSLKKASGASVSAFITPKPNGSRLPHNTYALWGHMCMHPPEARLWRLVTLGVHPRLIDGQIATPEQIAKLLEGVE